MAKAKQVRDAQNLPDRLQVSVTTTRGAKKPVTLAGAAYLTTTKGFNMPFNQIAIEVEHTSGHGVFSEEHKRNEALLNIMFEDRSMWAGTFEELKKKLLAPPATMQHTGGGEAMAAIADETISIHRPALDETYLVVSTTKEERDGYNVYRSQDGNTIEDARKEYERRSRNENISVVSLCKIIETTGFTKG